MYIIVFITTGSKKQARQIARALIKARLAACVNIIDNVESVFRWQGKVERAKEQLLIVKTKKLKLPALIKMVKSLHSYEVPEIIALPIIRGEKKYLRWIDESLR